jgi:tetratricopeptide (TPR) repeat protein
VKKPQWIALGISALAVVSLYLFVSTKEPHKKTAVVPPAMNTSQVNDGISTDTVLALAKRNLTSEQTLRINTLENSITRGAVKDQQLAVYHQLAHFWNDSAHIFEPFAWYEAQAARLENSEKNLTFAARLFLDNLQAEDEPSIKKWKALQAKDLFERSLILNPDNDSAKVGLGATYLFGEISESPMEGIQKIREVVQKDSTNVYAQVTLARGAILSGQYDKAITRLEQMNKLQPANAEVMLLLAEAAERTNDKAAAIAWYSKSLPLVKNPEAHTAIQKRIEELKK